MSVDPKYVELQQELKRLEDRFQNFTSDEQFKNLTIDILIFIARILLYKI